MENSNQLIKVTTPEGKVHYFTKPDRAASWIGTYPNAIRIAIRKSFRRKPYEQKPSYNPITIKNYDKEEFICEVVDGSKVMYEEIN